MFVNLSRLRILYLFVASVVLSLPTQINGTDSDTQTQEAALIQKYVVLCGQNTSDRIQSIQALNSTEKAYVWRLHLGLYLAGNPDFSRDQQGIILELLTLTTPQLFNPPNPNKPNERSVLEQVDLLRRRGLQIFSKDEAAKIFSAVGEPQDGEAVRLYSQLSELDKAERKASFSLMSADQKVSTWRVHFGLNLARHPEWNDQQRSIVLEGIGMVKPELYKVPKDKTWTRIVDEPVRLFTQKALLVFTRAEVAALFSELGFAEEPKSNHAKRAPGNCSCSQECDWCTHGCVGADCTVLTWGCGTFGLYACNGTCYVPPNNN